MEMTRTSLDGTCPMHFMAAAGLLRLAPRHSRGAWGEDKRLRISAGVADPVAERLVAEGARLEAFRQAVENKNQLRTDKNNKNNKKTKRDKKNTSEVSGSTLRLLEQDAHLLDMAPPPMIALQHPSWTDGKKLLPSHWVFTAGNQRFLPTIADAMSTATPNGIRALLAGADQPQKGTAIWDYERQTLARARSAPQSTNWRRPLLDALAFAGLPTWPIHVPHGPAGWTRRRGDRWFQWALWRGALSYAAAALCVKSLLGERWAARRARPKGYYRYFSHSRLA